MKKSITIVSGVAALGFFIYCFKAPVKNPVETREANASAVEIMQTQSDKKIELAEENLAKTLFMFSETLDKQNKEKQNEYQSISSEDEIMAAYMKTANPQLVMQKYAERRKARAELLQRKMDEENQDPIWEDALRKRFNELGSILPGVNTLTLSQADCRQSICALHLNYTDREEYKKVAPYIANAGIVLGSDAFIHYDAEPSEAVLYVSREDQVLPDMVFTDEG